MVAQQGSCQWWQGFGAAACQDLCDVIRRSPYGIHIGGPSAPGPPSRASAERSPTAVVCTGPAAAALSQLLLAEWTAGRSRGRGQVSSTCTHETVQWCQMTNVSPQPSKLPVPRGAGATAAAAGTGAGPDQPLAVGASLAAALHLQHPPGHRWD